MAANNPMINGIALQFFTVTARPRIAIDPRTAAIIPVESGDSSGFRDRHAANVVDCSRALAPATMARPVHTATRTHQAPDRSSTAPTAHRAHSTTAVDRVWVSRPAVMVALTGPGLVFSAPDGPFQDGLGGSGCGDGQRVEESSELVHRHRDESWRCGVLVAFVGGGDSQERHRQHRQGAPPVPGTPPSQTVKPT